MFQAHVLIIRRSKLHYTAYGIITKILCIKLVNYWDKYTEMHGQQNVKICNAKQAKQVHQYKNTEIKLYNQKFCVSS